MRIFLLAISFPPCSYSSTTCLAVALHDGRLSRRPIGGHGPWQLPHRPVSNLSLHPFCRHLRHYILLFKKTQYLFWNFFRKFRTFFPEAFYRPLSKNIDDTRVFQLIWRLCFFAIYNHRSGRIIMCILSTLPGVSSDNQHRHESNSRRMFLVFYAVCIYKLRIMPTIFI